MKFNKKSKVPKDTHQYMLGAPQLESSLAENELGFLVGQAEHKLATCLCGNEGSQGYRSH